MAGRNKLTNLDTLGVSLVRRGANKKRFALSKSEGTMEGFEEVIKAVLEAEMDDEASVDEVLKQAKLSDRGMKAVKGALRLLNAFKDELPKDIMKMLAGLAGYGDPEPDEKAEKPDEDKYKEPTMKDSGPDLQALPDDIRNQVESLWKANQDEIKKREELEAILKAERDEREQQEFVAKAAKEFSHLPGTPETIGTLLKSVKDASPELAGQLEELLKSTEAMVSKSELLTELGQSARGDTGGSAWEQIEKAAESVVQKSANQVSKSQAISSFLCTPEGGQLYNAYLANHPAQTRPELAKS